MRKIFEDGETLPNGIFVHRLVNFQKTDDTEIPWVASISIGGWHYSQWAETKEKAVKALYPYMERVKADFQDVIRIKTEQIKALEEFLAKKCTE
jgi:hypothetical protein